MTFELASNDPSSDIPIELEPHKVFFEVYAGATMLLKVYATAWHSQLWAWARADAGLPPSPFKNRPLFGPADDIRNWMTDAVRHR